MQQTSYGQLRYVTKTQRNAGVAELRIEPGNPVDPNFMDGYLGSEVKGCCATSLCTQGQIIIESKVRDNWSPKLIILTHAS